MADVDKTQNVITFALSTIGTVIGLIYQLINFRKNSVTIKQNLELLKMLDKDTDKESYDIVKDHINNDIKNRYSINKKTGYNSTDLAVGIIFMVAGIAVVSYYYYKSKVYWWVWLIGAIFAFISMGGFLNAFDPKRVKK